MLLCCIVQHARTLQTKHLTLKRHIGGKNSKCVLKIKHLSKIKIGARKYNKLKSLITKLECNRYGLKFRGKQQLKHHQIGLCLPLLKRYSRNCCLYIEKMLYTHIELDVREK